jgi:hypothetical protein
MAMTGMVGIKQKKRSRCGFAAPATSMNVAQKASKPSKYAAYEP